MNTIRLDNYDVNYQVFFKNNKHNYLRIKNKQLIVTAHKKMSSKDIERFISQHKEWIIKHLNQEKIDLYDRQYLKLWNEPLKVLKTDQKSKHLSFDKNELLVYRAYDFQKSLEQFYKNETKKEMTRIINEEKDHLKLYFDLDDLTIKSQLMKSRLGSCIASKKIIKLNSLLARFEKEYLKMVLYHELVHLIVQNHSKKFYNILLKIYPNYRSMNKLLKHKIKFISYL